MILHAPHRICSCVDCRAHYASGSRGPYGARTITPERAAELEREAVADLFAIVRRALEKYRADNSAGEL